MNADDSEKSSLDWPQQIGRADVFLQTLAERKRFHRRRRFGFAGASGAVLLVCGVIAHSIWFRPPVELSSASPALLSMPRQLLLPDGSIVELKSGAEVALAFSEQTRRIALRSGEAYFQVANDPLRPFVVEAGGVEVQAVGTAFCVQLGAEAVEIVVNEGSVLVAPAAPTTPVAAPAPPTAHAASTPVSLAAGQRVTVERIQRAAASSANPAVESVSAQELAERLAWRVPRLELRGTPLAQAIAELNRYAQARLTLHDPALGAIELSGILRADNVNALLQLLDTNYGIKAETRPDGSIVLRKAP